MRCPVAFFSKKMTPTQQLYTVGEKELMAIVETLRVYRTILFGHRLIIYTDHKNLTFTRFSSDRVRRWRLFVEEYGPELCYIPEAAMRRLMHSVDSHSTMGAPPPQSKRSFMLKPEACGRKKKFSAPSLMTSSKRARRLRWLSRSDKVQRSGASGELNLPSIGTIGSWCHPRCGNQFFTGITTCWGTPER